MRKKANRYSVDSKKSSVTWNVKGHHEKKGRKCLQGYFG